MKRQPRPTFACISEGGEAARDGSARVVDVIGRTHAVCEPGGQTELVIDVPGSRKAQIVRIRCLPELIAGGHVERALVIRDSRGVAVGRVSHIG